MKKLYRKGSVHPSPPIISDHLSFLPAAIITLAAALSTQDREVLAYLISCSSVNDFHGHRKNTTHRQKTVCFAKTRTIGGSGSSNNDHPPVFNCDCFRCYMSYWVRWDNSPNRQLIHEIIDAFEEDQLVRNSSNNKKTRSNKKDKKKRGGGGGNDYSGELKLTSTTDHHHLLLSHDSTESVLSAENNTNSSVGDADEEVSTEKGPVRSFVSFIGEKIWGVWG
ncbi:hypothetical protein Ddye_012879 [Dipteronia dyeriana]|uniref:Uncharacterized protein n=1 Tax=Dipteronia dyeriana TaxID=168575 RepID=A0AAE0CJN6_9ROSI|nr:hypothetical protein Ddye_012879 [Dipteronia dyeriana]